jgi:molybdenum cofactor biosynthesis enzyme MoaA
LINKGTIGEFTADVADTCGKWPYRSLNQLLLYGLNLDPVRRVLSLVKGRQAAFHGLIKEVPRVGRLQARRREKVVRSSAIDEELEGEGWLKA